MKKKAKKSDNDKNLIRIVLGNDLSDFADQKLPRRAFLQGQFLNTLKKEQIRLQGYDAILPPWANLAIFLEKCTACRQCVAVCETQIIKFSDAGFPEIDFSKGECTFCQKCVEICSEPIFRSTEEEAWAHKVEVTESCLLSQKIECRACGDYCESRAIRFKPQLGGIAKLELDLPACNGCGACIGVCPVSAVKILRE
ncbi:ferredoxin-type protein NapF [Actinobacillus minor NM305]|uniref:Ferredoxin-type protein NapF n=1 Tax=Actinobacillus minor NM305 TaxID=637911 RepID=C5RZS3_9PAST|nr:ferredoxin-type protein NapF [Actinobacillus minor NM305]